MASRNGFSMPMLLLSAGILYVVSGVIFRIPMAVQPLKSIATMGVALGASQATIGLSAALIGIGCLLISLLNVDELSKIIPVALVHGLQLGLGVLLFLQGFRISVDSSTYPLVAFAFCALMVIASFRFQLPLLGGVATIGFVWATLSDGTSLAPSLSHSASYRMDMVISLFLPQFVLTIANSVIGTADVAKRYFGNAAAHVTPRRLLLSLGFGNILFSLIGGLPFCHGSGGVTAHVRGGANHYASNLIIGTTLTLLGIASFWGSSFSFNFPPLLLSALLMAAGVFHAWLAMPSLLIRARRVRLILMFLVALLTQNLLLVLAVGCLSDAVRLAKGTGRIAQ